MECSISPIPDNCEHVADRCRLGIRAAWDPDFRDRGYDNYFESLDRFTAHLDFPRRGHFADGGAEDRKEVKKRRAMA
jgi:hypothetical protein